MKRSYKNIIYMLSVLIFVIFINIILKGKDIYYLMLSFSMYLIFITSFSHINIKDKLKEYKDKNNIYSMSRLFYLTILSIIIINIVYILLIYIVKIILTNSDYLNRYGNILLIMGSTIFIIPVLKIIIEYLNINNYKKISNILFKIFIFLWIIGVTILLILSNYISISIYLFMTIIYLLQFIALLLILLIIIFIIKNKNIFSIKIIKKREENKISLFKELKQILKENISISIKNMIFVSYYYISIIFVYFVILYGYNYVYEDIINVIIDTYFYDCSFVLIISIMFILKYKIKDKNIEVDKIFITIIRETVPITMLLCILSGPILKLLYDSNNSLIFMMLVWLIPFIVYYTVSIKLLEKTDSKKTLYVMLISGIIVKTIVTIPLINSLYRMGYNLIYGDIISNIIGLFISCIISTIYLNKKYKINFTKCFDKILNIVYKNIILCFVLVISSIFISLKTTNVVDSLIVIVIYIVIFIVYIFINRVIDKIKK